MKKLFISAAIVLSSLVCSAKQLVLKTSTEITYDTERDSILDRDEPSMIFVFDKDRMTLRMFNYKHDYIYRVIQYKPEDGKIHMIIMNADGDHYYAYIDENMVFIASNEDGVALSYKVENTEVIK